MTRISWSLGVSENQTIPGSYTNGDFMDDLFFFFNWNTYYGFPDFFRGRWSLGPTW